MKDKAIKTEEALTDMNAAFLSLPLKIGYVNFHTLYFSTYAATKNNKAALYVLSWVDILMHSGENNFQNNVKNTVIVF